ncbi:Trypanosomal VSG domain containing protein, putative [Trypanosoma equiperdum]|uniref:Trypanosomal VSG domain containing protein, putative n=1 Tax=Trypanosoma equiperdum TaxID=5694 RepID=A0A1G4IKJ7_TRYEQ|nr:Trypanosomal VSG domain containing protein, putative [Trypanosoma equiperdum]
MKLKEQAQLLWICFALSTPSARCTVNDGANGQYYSVTCTILNMLTSGFPQADTPNSVQSLAGEIGALNLSLSDQQFSNLIAHDKDWGEAPIKAATDNKPYAQDWQHRYQFWKAAASKIKEQEAAYKAWQTLKLSSDAIHTIRELANQVYETYTDTELASFEVTKTAITTAANQTIYGKASNGDKDESPTTNSRVADCGKANGNAGDNGQVAKPCCDQCSDATTIDWGSTANKVPKAWARIKNNCPSHAPTLALNSANMAIALANFQQVIAPIATNTNKKQYILGTLDGTGAAGCTGSSAGTNGVCVIYKTTTDNNVIKANIDWVRHALNAAQQGTKLIQRERHIKQLEAKLRILNITASLQKHKVISQHQATEETSRNKGTQETSENEKNCNKHHDRQDNCTTSGCDYDANAKDGKKLEKERQMLQEQEKQQQG